MWRLINVAAAFAGFAAAALALRLSRAPGWRDLLPAALVTGAGAALGVVTVALADARAAAFAPTLAQLRLAAGGAGVAAWLVYAGRDLGVVRRRAHRAVIAIALVAGALAAIPGLAFRAPVVARPCASAGVVFFDPTSTPAAAVLEGVLLLALAAIPAWYTGAAVRRRQPALALHAAAFAVLTAAAVNDVLGISGWVDTPYFLGMAALAPVAVASFRLARRFALDAAALAALRGGLEELAEQRAAELTQTDEALERAARLADLGRAAASVGDALAGPSDRAERAIERAIEARASGDRREAAAAVQAALADARRIADVARAHARRISPGRH